MTSWEMPTRIELNADSPLADKNLNKLLSSHQLEEAAAYNSNFWEDESSDDEGDEGSDDGSSSPGDEGSAGDDSNPADE